jgi:hypothetical protein
LYTQPVKKGCEGWSLPLYLVTRGKPLDLFHRYPKIATESTEVVEKKLLKLIFSVNSVAKKSFARG